MPNINEIMRNFDEQIDDLLRDTKFCLNNYDYHHKNNEYEILNKIRSILEDCSPDGVEFQRNLEQIKETIEVAKQKCSEVDDMIKELGITNGDGDGGSNNTSGGNFPTTGRSSSFIEEEVVRQENKENVRY
ncbi:uncharacterized protein [Musca autumnalis]|uniref:uncharacterized protein n=1 Tax=Musca autumnalis TaxID=221902 RepID=UPI003CED7CF2